MKKILLCLVGLSVATALFAQGTQSAQDTQVALTPLELFELNSDRRINLDPDIFSGPYLIYDCLNKRYVCVDEFSNEKCIDSREDSLNERSRLLSCAPLKKFDTYFNCTRANLFALEDARPVKFCFKK